MIRYFCRGFGFTLGVIFAIPVAATTLKIIETAIGKEEKKND